jgi:hypothetical protein
VDELNDEDAKNNRGRYLNSGTHWAETGYHISYSKGELMIGQKDVEYLLIKLRFFVKVCRKKIISKFEVEGRGRAFSFEPIEDLENGKRLEIHLVQKV